MAKTVNKEEGNRIALRQALTPEAEENQLVALATELAKKRLQDGTASNQVIVHYLKEGSMKAKLERERLEKENELLKAKTEAIKASQDIKELLGEAMKAFSEYRGDSNVVEEE